MTPSAAASRIFQVEAALGSFAKIGRFDVRSIEVDATTAVVWVVPPEDGSQLAAVADLYSRTTIGRTVEEIRVIRERAYRVELRWIERFAKVPS